MTHSIATVLHAASDYDLVDLATVKDELGITDTASDTKLARWITATSKRFANICGVTFPEEGLSEVFRGHWFLGSTATGPIVLTRRPVTLVTSVTEGSTLLTADTDYETDLKAGLIYRITDYCRTHWRPSPTTVVYSAGFYPIPADVSDAVLAIMRHKWATTGRDPLLRSFEIQGVGREDYWVPLSTGLGDLPPDLQPVADTIAHYRGFVIA